MEESSQPVYVSFDEGGISNSKKRRLFIIGLAILAVLIMAGASFYLWSKERDAVNADDPFATVEIQPEGFDPATIKIKKGQEVAWVNADPSEPHEIFADQQVTPGLDSTQPLVEGDTYIYTFEKSGRFNYYDPLLPGKFKGTVIVE